MRNFVLQWSHVKQWQKFCKETLKNVFSNAKKRLQEICSGTFSARIFFMFVLLISNHTVSLVQFDINLHLWVFQKAEITLAEAARAISAFWKTHSCKLIPNWTRNRMITYTNCDLECQVVMSFAHCRKPNRNNTHTVTKLSILPYMKKPFLRQNALRYQQCLVLVNTVVYENFCTEQHLAIKWLSSYLKFRSSCLGKQGVKLYWLRPSLVTTSWQKIK